MKRHTETWQEEARLSVEAFDQLWSCHAPEGYFGKWDDMPIEYRAEIDAEGPIPCEGGGHLGPWCEHCRFMDIGW